MIRNILVYILDKVCEECVLFPKKKKRSQVTIIDDTSLHFEHTNTTPLHMT